MAALNLHFPLCRRESVMRHCNQSRLSNSLSRLKLWEKKSDCALDCCEILKASSFWVWALARSKNHQSLRKVQSILFFPPQILCAHTTSSGVRRHISLQRPLNECWSQQARLRVRNRKKNENSVPIVHEFLKVWENKAQINWKLYFKSWSFHADFSIYVSKTNKQTKKSN